MKFKVNIQQGLSGSGHAETILSAEVDKIGDAVVLKLALEKAFPKKLCIVSGSKRWMAYYEIKIEPVPTEEREKIPA